VRRLTIEAVTTILICLLSVLAHEAGHVLTARIVGVKIVRLGVDWRGPYILRKRTTGLPEVAICLAGIAANVAIACATSGPAQTFNLAMIFVNLLWPRSDGRNALAALSA
jgi:membrane-associated protease RseP (regulator of RpoE activity)